MNKGPDHHPPLPSPLRRVFYLSSGGGEVGNGDHRHEREVLPRANPRVVSGVSCVCPVCALRICVFVCFLYKEAVIALPLICEALPAHAYY